MTSSARAVEWSAALAIPRINFRAGGEKDLDYFQVTSSARFVEWSPVRAIPRINFPPGGNQAPDFREIAGFRRLVQSHSSDMGTSKSRLHWGIEESVELGVAGQFDWRLAGVVLDVAVGASQDQFFHDF